MLFDLDKIKDFFTTLLRSKTSVIEGVFSFPQTKKVAEGMLIYGRSTTDIKIYTCEDIVFRDHMSMIAYIGTHVEIVFDKAYFDKLMASKFKSAFFGACAIQVARYILYSEKAIQIGQKGEFYNHPPCLPSHKPEIAKFFFSRTKKTERAGRPGGRQVVTSYANFIAQALLRGGFDLEEYAVDKKALSFFPIDDVLAAHAVDVETQSNLFISAERVNRIRALHHYYETDLTHWDGCELQIDLL